MMCPSRHAMVVTGDGSGAGNSKSITRSPVPAAMAVVASARGRTLQAPGAGSQKYCSSVSPSRRARHWYVHSQST